MIRILTVLICLIALLPSSFAQKGKRGNVPKTVSITDTTINSIKYYKLPNSDTYVDKNTATNQLRSEYTTNIKAYAGSIAAAAREKRLSAYRTSVSDAFFTINGTSFQDYLDTTYISGYVGLWQLEIDTSVIGTSTIWSNVVQSGGVISDGFAKFDMYLNSNGVANIISNFNNVLNNNANPNQVGNNARFRLRVNPQTLYSVPYDNTMLRATLLYRPTANAQWTAIATFKSVAYVESIVGKSPLDTKSIAWFSDAAGTIAFSKVTK